MVLSVVLYSNAILFFNISFEIQSSAALLPFFYFLMALIISSCLILSFNLLTLLSVSSLFINSSTILTICYWNWFRLLSSVLRHRGLCRVKKMLAGTKNRVQDKSTPRQIGTWFKRQISTWTNQHLG